jgi:hypothetical protein
MVTRGHTRQQPARLESGGDVFGFYELKIYYCTAQLYSCRYVHASYTRTRTSYTVGTVLKDRQNILLACQRCAAVAMPAGHRWAQYQWRAVQQPYSCTAVARKFPTAVALRSLGSLAQMTNVQAHVGIPTGSLRAQRLLAHREGPSRGRVLLARPRRWVGPLHARRALMRRL